MSDSEGVDAAATNLFEFEKNSAKSNFRSNNAVPRELYSPMQIACAAYLGSPLAGGVLYAMNCARRGNLILTVLAPIVCQVFSVVLIMVCFSLPREAMIAVAIGSLFCVIVAPFLIEGQNFHKHRAKGGEYSSTLIAIPICVACWFVNGMVLMLTMVDITGRMPR
ncbi:MAG: hypothetical protein E6Q76_04525 [Rhizobium sp.]|nr:MAG: hypothetical protein E6Q76_04525 [Rhizobium sp.]